MKDAYIYYHLEYGNLSCGPSLILRDKETVKELRLSRIASGSERVSYPDLSHPTNRFNSVIARDYEEGVGNETDNPRG